MNPVAQNTLALVAGLILGCVVNLGLVNLSTVVFPLPEGADTSTMEGLKESIKLFKPQNFLFPFLGHALGTLVGAFVVARFTTKRQLLSAMSIGALFLVGGIMMVVSVGGPIWFILSDLVLAYLPMAWLGYVLAGSPTSNESKSTPDDPTE